MQLSCGKRVFTFIHNIEKFYKCKAKNKRTETKPINLMLLLLKGRLQINDYLQYLLERKTFEFRQH